ncbi:MAG TPA: NADH-quinone oxidoreductase subunit L, partial [Holophaga sp.]|nr:NADH-quinone oxidoreductase subunit L [Holophaga sp.]
MSGPHLILLPFGALLGGVALQLLLGRFLSPRTKGWLAFLAVLGALAGVLSAWPTVGRGGILEASFGRWDGPIQLAYRVDGLSLLFALMGTGIGTAVLLYSISYMEHEQGTTRFYALMLTFVAGLVHLVYTADLFLVYLSWEAVGVCSFLLVGFWYRKGEAAYGARKVLTMTHLTGYGLLAAVVLLYVRTGSTLWTDPKVQAALGTGLFLAILVAALAKSVQFPLHTWIPDAMAAPTPVSALLHAACYVKAGVYLVARLHAFGPWPAAWSLTVSWVGAATLLIGALLALAQQDLKRLLAFSTVSQIGYMMLGLGLGTPLGIAAGLLHCLNHGLFKGGLFLCAGAVQHATGTRDMDQLGVLGRRMPRTAALWLVVAGSIMGVPLLNGFVSKWLLYNAALEAGQPLLALVPWVGSIITVFMLLKATTGVFLGSEGPASGRAHEATWSMLAGIGILGGGCVLLGVAPQLAIAALVNPVLPALGCAPLTGIGWFGLAAGQGS